MTDPRPFKIQVFVAEGRPDGLRLIEKSNWVGLGIVCPRGSYARVKKREEFARSGVYILVGPGDDDRPRIYVGEAEMVGVRLDEHYVSKDFWQQAIVFTTTGTPRNKAEIRYLEARLLELARQHERCELENRTKSQRPGLSEADVAEMEGYLDELLSLLPVLGIYAFEPKETISPDQHLYYLKVKQCDATGFETSTGFTVLKGSLARPEPTRALRNHFPSYVKKREQLVEDGVLLKDADRYRFARDHHFNSPSQASTVCAGRSSNGLDDWKDGEGFSIKQNRAKAASE
ncbi:GIY-YIG nuclease family protein [Candidatus Palauibacter sp.]|uniref:GIY-YIG nuclease family protein n=1 Tax=Candidatus Palauibacter sp. TaxID=3101350 RepID=UPI003B0181AD